MPRAASRVGLLGTETALDVLVKARAVEARGRQVIHLEVGEPDFPTPGHIVEAGVRALRDGYTRYGPPAGSPGLREAIAEHLAQRGVLADRHDLWVMADEIYRRIRYGADAPSIAALPGMLERTILVDGFSKAYAMTGWRLGWGLFPPALAPHAVRLVINSNTCTASFVQEAGIAALRGPQDVVEAMVARFRTRRDAIVARLARIPGVRCHEPAGAFYAFPDVRALPLSAAALADRLLQEEAVALLDGAGFGPGGSGYLRLSFASSLENLEEAADRFSSLVARL